MRLVFAAGKKLRAGGQECPPYTTYSTRSCA